MAWAYILYSAALDRYYVGSTDLTPEERLKKHLTNHAGFTARAKDWIIFYQEEFENLTEAKKREQQVKSWKSRQMIEKLIQNSN